MTCTTLLCMCILSITCCPSWAGVAWVHISDSIHARDRQRHTWQYGLWVEQVVGVAWVQLILIGEHDASEGLNLGVLDACVSSVHRGHRGENGTCHTQKL